ncbi:MAG: hypothetical protein ACXWW1_08620 [Aeromicrobium sp.]
MKKGSLLTLCLLMAAAVTVVGCTSASATEQRGDADTGGGQPRDSQPPFDGGDDPITGPPIDEPPLDPTFPGGATPVEPQPGIVDSLPHAWDRIDVASDGRTITVYYWGGVEACYGLDRVDVSRDDDGLLQVTVFEGRRGDLPPDTACIEIAVLKSVTITLDQPIIAPSV